MLRGESVSSTAALSDVSAVLPLPLLADVPRPPQEDVSWACSTGAAMALATAYVGSLHTQKFVVNKPLRHLFHGPAC